LEKKLDDIAEEKENYISVLTDFYGEFKQLLEEAEKELAEGEKIRMPQEELEETCPLCGCHLVIKSGRFGKFAACPNYPECKTTVTLSKEGKVVMPEAQEETVVEGMQCELCGGPVVLKRGRFGEFYACKNYPTCRFTRQKTRPVGVKCPKCGGEIVEKRGRKSVFYGCDHYPQCDFSLWNEPTGQTCPQCGSLLVRMKNQTVACSSKECKYKES
jgi:DNA topoisomerase-1